MSSTHSANSKEGERLLGSHTPFSYDLPVERIAQRPVSPSDSAKLLVLDRGSGVVHDSRFSSLCDFIAPRDILVFNDSRVIPARMLGKIQATGGAVELLLLEEIDTHLWRSLGKPLRKLRVGLKMQFGNELLGEVIEREQGQSVLIKFSSEGTSSVAELIRLAGIMPIPPYIRGGRADSQDERDYQSLFAKTDGSVAAPTASLHFTTGLIDRIKELGCRLAYVTLHVGSPSFLPLWSEEDGPEGARAPGIERFQVDPETLATIKDTRAAGGRVIAVGTTVVRALESIGMGDDETSELNNTELFISPGYQFRLVDALITNFHQPRTSHLLLVESLTGMKLLQQSYDHALANKYRFLSYGDGMLII